MKTSTLQSSLFVSLLAGLVACGGGGGDEFEADTEARCMAAVVADANRLIAEHGPLQCRVWIVDGAAVDGTAYPEFLIGGDL